MWFLGGCQVIFRWALSGFSGLFYSGFTGDSQVVFGWLSTYRWYFGNHQVVLKWLSGVIQVGVFGRGLGGF